MVAFDEEKKFFLINIIIIIHSNTNFSVFK